jgi:hypothetical protein
MENPPKVGDHTHGYFTPGSPYHVQHVGETSTCIHGDGLMEYEITAVVEDVSIALQTWFGTITNVVHRKRPRHRLPPHLRSIR